MGMPLELKELLHNLKDRSWDVNPVYQIDENEAEKVIKQLDMLDSMFVNSEEIKHDDEVFDDDYADKNIQNGWIYCKDRLPNINEWVLCHCQANIKEILRLTYDGWNKDNSHCYMESFVIAWQPLPKWEGKK
jgi:hypothetical protein